MPEPSISFPTEETRADNVPETEPPRGQLVHYSVHLSDDPELSARVGDLLDQLDASLTTLRRYNRSTDVVVFHHGPAPTELAALAERHQAGVVEQPHYRELLESVVPAGAPWLIHYPLLHKFCNFAGLARLNPAQTLYIDCDTLFFDDVDKLFNRYRHQHVVAREEPFTRRSPHGHDSGYIDESAFETLMSTLGLGAVAPFNTGVVLMNHLPWSDLIPIGRLSVEVAWRYLIWMAVVDHQRTGQFGRLESVSALQGQPDVLDQWSHLALPFPSSNQWILDEVSLWTALGAVPGLTSSDFSMTDVPQSGEIFQWPIEQVPSILCHYYSVNTDAVRQWSHEQAVA